MCFGKAVFPKAHPAFDGELLITWGAEEMEMIRHEEIITDEPGCGFMFPDLIQSALHGWLSEPAFAVLNIDSEENPIGSLRGNVDAFCGCAATGDSVLAHDGFTVGTSSDVGKADEGVFEHLTCTARKELGQRGTFAPPGWGRIRLGESRIRRVRVSQQRCPTGDWRALLPQLEEEKH